MYSSRRNYLAILCILALSIYSYFPGYEKPASLFWDENFHIASAQRYLNGVFFMEPHPPLGKLLIAAGEFLLKANPQNDQFISLEQASDLPDDFSFSGYRLIPVIFSCLIPILLFLIIHKVSNNSALSFFIALIPAFDNALIVHGRGAMLEGIQIFFILLSILAFLNCTKTAIKTKAWLTLLSISSACALLVKINSAAILILPFFLIRTVSLKSLILLYILPFTLTYYLVWQIHFGLGVKIEPELDNKGYFAASEPLKSAIKQNEIFNPINIVTGILDSFDFSKRYQTGVDTLNYCKSEENGSYPLLWPIGARAIQYRWDDSQYGTKYLYLVANPWGWLIGFAGAIAASSLLLSNFLGTSVGLKNPKVLIVILIMYFATWLAPLLMDRVFYLYHYFVPLILSWILLGLVCIEIKQIGVIQTSNNVIRWSIVFTHIFLLIASYVFFSPLTYHKPISDNELNRRSLLSLWDLRCKNCNSINPIARPIISDSIKRRTDPEWKLKIGSVEANYIEQSLGIPKQIDSSFHIMTKSRIQLPVNNKFSSFSGTATLDPNHLDGEVRFKIIGNGDEIWNSGILNLENPKINFNLDIKSVSILILVVETPNQNDPSTDAIWSSLSLN